MLEMKDKGKGSGVFGLSESSKSVVLFLCVEVGYPVQSLLYKFVFMYRST